MTKVEGSEQPDTMTTNEIYSGHPIAIFQCFLKTKYFCFGN